MTVRKVLLARLYRHPPLLSFTSSNHLSSLLFLPMETYASPQLNVWNRRSGCNSGSELQPNADIASDNTHLSSGFANSLLHFAFRREKRSRKDESASNAGLSNIAVEELEKVLQPIVRQIEELDAESLLHLTRVSSGGAQLGDGYVPI